MNKAKRVVIVANGEINDLKFFKLFIQSSDYVIAVDGGGNSLNKIGFTPDMAIGDFDSIDPDILAEYVKLGVKIERFPCDKNFTDTELALNKAKKISKNVVITGAFGKRFDHTFANIYLLCYAQKLDINLEIVDEFHRIFMIKSGERKNISGNIGDTVSIIPILPSNGIISHGLKYPLKKEELFIGRTRGMSNVKIKQEAWISIEKGCLFIFLVKKEVEV